MDAVAAKQEGVKAYRAGKGRAPALNLAFLHAADKAGKLVELMDAYAHGWTVAMLADGVADKGMPSVRELAAIEAA